MKENSKNIEKIISPEEVSNIDPMTISKIELLDGTIIKVQKYILKNKDIEKKEQNNKEIGAITNLKLNHISNSYKKPENTFSYKEWDFPVTTTKNLTFRKKLEELSNIKLNIQEKQQFDQNINSEGENMVNCQMPRNNYSFYESKHVSSKNKDNKSKEKNPFNSKDNEDNKKEKIIKKKNLVKKNKKISPDKKKDDLTFKEKINMLKYGILDYNNNDINSTNNDEENNVQKINKIRPLNFMVEKNKKNKTDDINTQFEQLVNKFKENKNSNRQNSQENTDKFLSYKTETKCSNLNDDINKLNSLIQKNKLNTLFSNNNGNEFSQGSKYNDLNERIVQLRNKTLYDNKNSERLGKIEQRKNMLVLPSNFK